MGGPVAGCAGRWGGQMHGLVFEHMLSGMTRSMLVLHACSCPMRYGVVACMHWGLTEPEGIPLCERRAAAAFMPQTAVCVPAYCAAVHACIPLHAHATAVLLGCSPGRSNSTRRSTSGCSFSICTRKRKVPQRSEHTSALSRWNTFCVVHPYSGTRSCIRASWICGPAVGQQQPARRSAQRGEHLHQLGYWGVQERGHRTAMPSMHQGRGASRRHRAARARSQLTRAIAAISP